MKGRKPTTAESEYMQRVSDLGCIVCRLFKGMYTPCEIHHIEGKIKEGAHFKIIGLCYYHHRQGGMCDLYVSRHPYKKEFEKRYGSEYELMDKTNQLLAIEYERK